jgi:cell division protein FtsB
MKPPRRNGQAVNKKNNHPRKKRKWSNLVILFFWLILIGIFSGAIIMQASGYNHYRRELNKVMEDLEREKRIHTELLNQIIYYESDAYIERLARDQLGYVRPDEIVFVNIAD